MNRSKPDQGLKGSHLHVLPQEPVRDDMSLDMARLMLHRIQREGSRIRASQSLWISVWGALIILAIVVFG